MCIYKCMFNVYKNQQNRQTGSRNLTGKKTLPTIWGTFCLPTLLIFIHIEHIHVCSFFVAFFSATIDGRNLIFGHKLHIVTPVQENKLLVMKIHVPILNKMKICSLEVYNWHQFVIVITCSDNVCPYLVLVHVSPSDSYFLFAEEQGYHKWALAHSSSC
jgi:hypothetical protein